MARRRGHGDDSIYKDGDRWRGAISLGYDGSGQRGRVKVSGSSREEVRDKLRALRQSVDAGLPIPDGRLTVGAFLERWLAVNLPGQIERTTLDDYSDVIRLHLKPALGKRLLVKLTVADVDEVWNAKREAGSRPNTIRIMRSVLRKAIGQAEREGLVLRNVAALSAPPRMDLPEGRSLTVDQARQLLAAAAGDRLETCYLLTLAYGMRRGEVLGLRWDDIDLDAGTISVRRAVKRLKTRD